MDAHSSISTSTIRAYEETEYRVFGNMPMTLRIGVRHALLACLHLEHNVECSAFVTAANPLGILNSDAENARYQTALSEELTLKGLRFISGVGQHPSGQWPGEPSFLILGLSLEAASQLGVQYKQNAIVWCGNDATPQLILLR